jgi:hypothetical protein
VQSFNLSINVTAPLPRVGDSTMINGSNPRHPVKDDTNLSAMSKQDKMAVLFANAEYAIAECLDIAPDNAARYADAVRSAESRMGTSPELLSQNAAYQRAYGYLVEHSQFVSEAERRQRCENLPKGFF